MNDYVFDSIDPPQSPNRNIVDCGGGSRSTVPPTNDLVTSDLTGKETCHGRYTNHFRNTVTTTTTELLTTTLYF